MTLSTPRRISAKQKFKKCFFCQFFQNRFLDFDFFLPQYVGRGGTPPCQIWLHSDQQYGNYSQKFEKKSYFSNPLQIFKNSKFRNSNEFPEEQIGSIFIPESFIQIASWEHREKL